LPRANETEYSIAREVLPRLHARLYIPSVASGLYSKLQSLLQGSELNLPEDLLEAADLISNPGEAAFEPDIRKFVDSLPAIIGAVGRKLVKEKCEFALKSYSDNAFATTELETEMERIGDHITLIYRFRNLIVHNARFDSRLLPYFAQRTGYFAQLLLKRITFERTTNRVDSVDAIVIADYAWMNRIMDRLDRNASVDLLDLNL
jgi:hypothetical protein